MRTGKEARDMSNLGFSLLNQDRIAEGMFLIKEALDASPNDACIFNNLAILYLKKKDYWSAVKFFWVTLEKFCSDKVNLDKHPDSLQIIQDDLNNALEEMENEGMAYLQARGPDGVDWPERATIIFKRALEFAPDKLSLRKKFIIALWMQGEEARSFAYLKLLVLDLVAKSGLKNLHQLNDAIRVYLPEHSLMVIDSAKERFSNFLVSEKLTSVGYNRLMRVLEIFLSTTT